MPRESMEAEKKKGNKTKPVLKEVSLKWQPPNVSRYYGRYLQKEEETIRSDFRLHTRIEDFLRQAQARQTKGVCS